MDDIKYQIECSDEKVQWLGCSEGFVFKRDPRLASKTVALYGEDGTLIATVVGVRYFHISALDMHG